MIRACLRALVAFVGIREDAEAVDGEDGTADEVVRGAIAGVTWSLSLLESSVATRTPGRVRILECSNAYPASI